MRTESRRFQLNLGHALAPCHPHYSRPVSDVLDNLSGKTDGALTVLGTCQRRPSKTEPSIRSLLLYVVEIEVDEEHAYAQGGNKPQVNVVMGVISGRIEPPAADPRFHGGPICDDAERDKQQSGTEKRDREGNVRYLQQEKNQCRKKCEELGIETPGEPPAQQHHEEHCKGMT